MSPFDSEDLTEIVEQDGKEFVAIRSPDTADHDPDYRELGRFPTYEKAQEFLVSVDTRWRGAPDPESRDSGFALRAPRNDE
jgi:hypothetical protein